MAEPQFKATRVGIGHRLRSLTRAGQVQIRDGKLTLMNSQGTEIDSAPVHLVRADKPWFASGDEALATVNGNRYRLKLGARDPEPGEDGPPSASSFFDAVRTAGGDAARE
ncbi:hypothetical protein [Streptomyces xinghaiensis]|uniref:hypothetical protein n=1 Tax=Streptomyces xinghaiensis TaxID=1038928 RepID=UPI0002DB3F64|nr:hypothetical protein [Streptomyces xinghaiensis]MZE81154.1 hypothetical protein [Streptomyces sp. SID5475]